MIIPLLTLAAAIGGGDGGPTRSDASAVAAADMEAAAAMPRPPADYEEEQGRLIAAEYAAALAMGSDEALRRFIERFPGHPLAVEAAGVLGRRGHRDRPG